jgi:hypothetical protein
MLQQSVAQNFVVVCPVDFLGSIISEGLKCGRNNGPVGVKISDTDVLEGDLKSTLKR